MPERRLPYPFHTVAEYSPQSGFAAIHRRLLYNRQRHAGKEFGRRLLLCRGIAQVEPAHKDHGIRKAAAQLPQSLRQRSGLFRKRASGPLDMQHRMPFAHAARNGKRRNLHRNAASPAAAFNHIITDHFSGFDFNDV